MWRSDGHKPFCQARWLSRYFAPYCAVGILRVTYSGVASDIQGTCFFVSDLDRDLFDLTAGKDASNLMLTAAHLLQPNPARVREMLGLARTPWMGNITAINIDMYDGTCFNGRGSVG